MISAIAKSMTPPDMHPKLVDEMSKVLAEEIDWEIMMGLLVELGYIRICMTWPERMNEVHAHEIKEWCRANLKEDYHGRGSDWYFKSEKDATMFSLRWA